MVDTVKVGFAGNVQAEVPAHRRVKLPGSEGVRFWHDGVNGG